MHVLVFQDLVTVPRAQHLPGWFVDYQRMLKEDEDDSEAQHRASYSLATKCEISVDEEMSGTVEQRATL